MKILLVEPGRAARPAEIHGELHEMQKIVGGTIQALYPWEDLAAVICNDEGKLMGLPLNRRLEDYDVIAGTFFICGIQGENFCGLTEQQLQKYQQMFRSPERIIPVPDGFLCLRIRTRNPRHRPFGFEKGGIRPGAIRHPVPDS